MVSAFASSGRLPLGRDPARGYLLGITGVLVLLLTLTAVTAIYLQDVAGGWRRSVAGQATLLLPPEATASDQARTVDALLESLRAAEGILAADVLSREKTAALLSPWLGDSADDPSLPLPLLIAIHLDPGAVDWPAIRRRTAAIAPQAQLDDHSDWVGRLLSFAGWLQGMAGAVCLLVVLCSVGTVVFITRAGLAVHREPIEMLHLMGAEDRFVARQFEQRVGEPLLLGSTAGAILALVLLGLIALALRPSADGGLFGQLPPPPLTALLVPFLLPVLVTVVGRVTAYWTVLRTLARLP